MLKLHVETKMESSWIKQGESLNKTKPQDSKNLYYIEYFFQIYMINLLRRPLRRERMYKAFRILGIEAKTVNAVDGK